MLKNKSRNVYRSDLDFKNYKAKFKLLLNLEELQAEQDIRHYDIGNTQVQKQGSRFLLKVKFGYKHAAWLVTKIGVSL